MMELTNTLSMYRCGGYPMKPLQMELTRITQANSYTAVI